MNMTLHVTTALSLMLIISDANASNVIEWHGDPIAIELTPGQERRIDWPSSVKVGIPVGLRPHIRVQSVGNTTHWTAARPFSAQRAMVTEIQSGQSYLLDVFAESGDGGTIPALVIQRKGESTESEAPRTEHRSNLVDLIDSVEEIRDVAREYLSPARLRSGSAIHARLPVVVEDAAISTDQPDIVATPLGAWRRSKRFVTAVELVNEGNIAITLRPANFRGQWHSVAMVSQRLSEAGKPGDRTLAFFISSHSFGAALRMRAW